MNRKYVNIYRISRVMMGPEEGGWFADYGQPIGSIPIEFTDEEWEEMRLDAFEKGVLVRNEGDGSVVTSFIPHEHEHSDWCTPDEHDIAYQGEEVPSFSVRCHENAWREHIDASLREKAQGIADYWSKMYPSTGKRSSVLGGEDHDVVIEDKMAEAFPKETPRYE